MVRTEQVEEEENDNDILASLNMLAKGKDGGNGLFMIDKELAARVTSVVTDFSKGIESAMKAASVA